VSGVFVLEDVRTTPAVPGPQRPAAGQPAPRRVVWKFGGTSVGDAGRLRAVAARLAAAHRAGVQVVAVLSATGGSTDELVRRAHEVSARPAARELDALLATGEAVSCALAAMAVAELGVPAVSLSGGQAGLRTDSAHGAARPRGVAPLRVLAALERGAVAVVTGYQGVAPNGDVTTLGRGGSDASAIVLAAALGLSECDIYTDVTGVFTADPRLVPAARRLASITHDEMLALADAGAKVLQPRAVELAAEHGVDVHVRSSFGTGRGTWVRRDAVSHVDGAVTGIAHDAGPDALGAGRVSVVGPMTTHRHRHTATLRAVLDAEGVAVRGLSATDGRLTCHVPADQVGRAAIAAHRAFGLDGPGPDTLDPELAEPAELTTPTELVGRAELAELAELGTGEAGHG
jgi:aspartate kinase